MKRGGLNMPNVKKTLLMIPVVLMIMPSLFSCSSQNDPNTVYLKVLNSEDYISNGEDDTVDLIAKFEEETKINGKKVKVVYDTFDTMENMYNTLKTGKTKYDLVCASEYMIQKLKNLDNNGDGESDIIEEIDLTKTGDISVENYKIGCSPFITDKLKTLNLEDESENKTYALCYMWGTLGILYNPTFFSSKIAEEIHDDMRTFDSLWNSKYKKSISIKDSMRDTYAIGLIETYRDFFLDEKDPEKRQKAFEYGGEDDQDAEKHIKEIQNKLLELRNNIFGFEVDSGKEDIIKGMIGIDTAWSGDAVYSINSAEEEAGLNLYYSIPEEGSNLWMDCWAMQRHDLNNEKEKESQDAAYKFLNFLSDSDNAISNMEAIGYTSPIATREIYEGYFEPNYYQEDGEPYDLEYFFGNGYGDLKVNPDKIGRQLNAQYPNNEDGTVNNLMVMQDYGKNNDLILKMWEEVKHEALPTWAIVLFVVEIAAIATAITVIITLRIRNKNRRKARKIRTA